MNIVLPVLAVVGGIGILAFAGDLLVRHAAAIAVRHHVPKAVVGAVILGFGTSLPEFFVSFAAALEGTTEIALSNVIGSNIANVGLILGVGGLLRALPVPRNVVRLDLPIGLLSTIFLLMWVQGAAPITRTAGFILLGGFLCYLWLTLRRTRTYRLNVDREVVEEPESRTIFWIVTGLVGLAGGAQVLVWGGVEIATAFNVSPRVIGLSLIAFGTSLPELAAMIAAARKGEIELAVGNIAGSNLFNLLFVLGATATFIEIPTTAVVVQRDIPIMGAFGVLAFPFLARDPWRLDRRQAGILLVAFVAYVVWMWGTRA
ncbi:MAG: calcium/sodium antiporter [Planctomycetota bacterium]|nr:calcium/sodium antiporter [Planctomycetota bacterium]